MGAGGGGGAEGSGFTRLGNVELLTEVGVHYNLSGLWGLPWWGNHQEFVAEVRERLQPRAASQRCTDAHSITNLRGSTYHTSAVILYHRSAVTWALVNGAETTRGEGQEVCPPAIHSLRGVDDLVSAEQHQ